MVGQASIDMLEFPLLVSFLDTFSVTWMVDILGQQTHTKMEPKRLPFSFSFRIKKSLLYGEAFESIMDIRQFVVLVVLLDCLGSRRFRLPDGQLMLPRPMVVGHREKSPPRFAPKLFSVGLFSAAILCNMCAGLIESDLP